MTERSAPCDHTTVLRPLGSSVPWEPWTTSLLFAPSTRWRKECETRHRRPLTTCRLHGTAAVLTVARRSCRFLPSLTLLDRADAPSGLLSPSLGRVQSSLPFGLVRRGRHGRGGHGGRATQPPRARCNSSSMGCGNPRTASRRSSPSKPVASKWAAIGRQRSSRPRMRSEANRSSEAASSQRPRRRHRRCGTGRPATSTSEKWRQGVSPTHSASRIRPLTSFSTVLSCTGTPAMECSVRY